MNDTDVIRSGEMIPLYRLLLTHQETLSPALCGLLTRIERRLYEHLSIEEIESIDGLSDSAVEALSKKL